LSAPLGWIEVRALAPIGWQELVADALTIGPCTSVAFGRPSLASDEPPPGFELVRTFIPSHADSPSLRAELSRTVASLAERADAPELADIALEFRALPPEDYATSWKKGWKAFRVGRLCVVAPWSAAHPRSGDVVMRLEPGGAFGSGRHATTRTCLRVIQERTGSTSIPTRGRTRKRWPRTTASASAARSRPAGSRRSTPSTTSFSRISTRT